MCTGEFTMNDGKKNICAIFTNESIMYGIRWPRPSPAGISLGNLILSINSPRPGGSPSATRGPGCRRWRVGGSPAGWLCAPWECWVSSGRVCQRAASSCPLPPPSWSRRRTRRRIPAGISCLMPTTCGLRGPWGVCCVGTRAGTRSSTWPSWSLENEKFR